MSTAAPETTKTLGNVIAGEERPAASGETFEKLAPATGEPLSARRALGRAGRRGRRAPPPRAAQPAWGAEHRRRARRILRDASPSCSSATPTTMAAIVAAETGKAPGEARGEVGAAIEMGYFVAGEGRRFYGRTTTSAVPNRQAMTIRQPLGVAGLIIAANTPIANVAWKVFPALLCGNARGAQGLRGHARRPRWRSPGWPPRPGLPPGVLNVVQGFGAEAGQPLVEHPGVDVVSFTGSTAVGRMIARVAGERLAKVCLELGGKNPLVVCDDADLEGAAEAAALSAYSQRRPALRRGQPDHRLRLGLRPLPRAAARAHDAPSASAPATSTTSAR